MAKGDSVDDPKLVNLVVPLPQLTVNGIELDMIKVAQAAERLGAQKQDVLSIGGYRNAKGELIPDYDTIRIEKRADNE
jgi:hypothetical protein